MSKLVLLTGFLGAGKTTFLNHILEEYADRKIGIIVNEFSNKGIDGALVNKTIPGMEMIELNNGSIFCACIKDHFVDSLLELSKKDLDYVFIEASGLADPSSICSILEHLEKYSGVHYDYLGSVCLTDALYFPKHVKILLALERQIKHSCAIIINKVDLVDSDDLTHVIDIIKGINPHAHIYQTTFAQVSLKEILSETADINELPEETTNSPSTRPKTITLTTPECIPLENVQKFIDEISEYTYRIKGFCKTTTGSCNVSVVGSICRIENWPVEIDSTNLVIISSVGIKIVSVVLEASKKYFHNDVSID